MSLWSWLTDTTPQSEQDATLAAIKAQEEAAYARRQDAGTLTMQDIASQPGYDATTNEDVSGAAEAGFIEGAKSGLSSVLSAPGKALGAVGSGAGRVLGGILKGVPWWVWVLAAGGLFYYLGGVAFVTRRARAAFAK